MFRKPVIFISILIFVFALISVVVLGRKDTHIVPKSEPNKTVVQKSPTPTYTPTPTPDLPFGMYTSPKIPKKDVYIIFMVGDSMTETLGPHGGKLSEFINTIYQSTPGHQRIVIDNYAKGSTNLLGLQDAMTKKTTTAGEVFDPLLTRPFDLILVESFGYNPLSQFGLQGGLTTQTSLLDGLMKTLTKTHPNSAIIFVATIAPNKETYALQESLSDTLAAREGQAQERMDYIKNHIDFAKSHNIPLIDIYDKSLTPNGDGNLSYINPNDHIHPSFEGTDFISHEISNYIYDNQILPR